MIPQRLKLQNFLSYRGITEIDFTNINSAVIIGENGAGKSSILDAITYALFGIARGTTKSGDNADRLITTGEDFTQIELEFLMENNRYLVARKRDLHRQSTELELNMRNEKEEGKWIGLTHSTIKATQEKIHNIIHVNHELFASSVMIMQGRADSFTRKDPSERKELLAEILQLDIYEQIREKIIDQKKVISSNLLSIKSFMEDAKERLSQKAVIENQLSDLNQAIQSKSNEINELKKKIQDISQEKNNIEKSLIKKKYLSEQLCREKNNIEKLQQDKIDYLGQIDEAQKIILKQNEIETGYYRLVDYITRDKKMNENLEIKNRIEKKIAELREKNAEEEHKLRLQKAELEKEESIYLKEKSNLTSVNLRIQSLQSEQKELERIKLKKIELEQSLSTINQQLAVIEENQNEKKKNLEKAKEQKEEICKKIYYFENILQEEANIEEHFNLIKENRVRLEVLNSEIEKESSKIKVYKAQIEETKKTIEDLEEKLAILSKTEGIKMCPVCGTHLSEQREADLKLNYNKNLQQKIETIEKNEKRIHEIIEELENKNKIKHRLEESLLQEKEYLEKKINISTAKAQLRTLNDELYKVKVQESQSQMDLDKLIKKKQDFRSRFTTADKQYTGYLQRLSVEGNLLRNLGELHSQMGKAMEAEQKLPSITEKLILLNRKLETKDYSKAILDDIRDLEKKLFEISYNPSLHKEIKQYIENFQYLETEKNKLDKKLHEKQLLTSEIKKIEEKIIQITELIQKTTEEIDNITYNETDLQGTNKIIELHQQTFDTALQTKEDLVIKHAGASEKLTQYKLLEKEFEEKNQEYRKLYHKETLLQRATEMFSKNGIQSFIIENALPEIEAKANQILDVISDGRLQVYFKVQSKTKKGSFRETMDIEISSEGQIRSYELFSGGEKFKVDLAIRIAISYVLSSKSGARLSVLMIDEGFGTQDKDGIMRFVECINRISDDFEKIFVITHMDELKDYFQTLIRVNKKNGFSKISIE